MNFHWGDSPMSWLRYMTLASFRKYHPDWEMVLWQTPITAAKTWQTGEASEAYDGVDWRDELPALGVDVELTHAPEGMPVQHAGDIVRWKRLAEGELYSDMDILYFCALPPILRRDGISCEDGILRVGLTSGTKDGVFADVLEVARDNYDPSRYQSVGVEAVYHLAFGHAVNDVNQAVGMDTLGLLTEVTGKPVYNIPTWWLHPIDSHQIHNSSSIRNDAVGIHWFGGLYESVRLSDEMTPDNWHQFSGAIPIALERALR